LKVFIITFYISHFANEKIKRVRAELDICRGGDSTQRDTASGIPLDSLGAANQVLPYIQGNIFDVTALMAHPCADIALFIIRDEHT